MTTPDGHHTKPTDSLDQVYRALSHAARRRLLLALHEENPRTLADLATMLAGPERQERKALVELHHAHLPRLANAGFVEWDRERETITKGLRFEDLRPHLDVLRE